MLVLSLAFLFTQATAVTITTANFGTSDSTCAQAPVQVTTGSDTSCTAAACAASTAGAAAVGYSNQVCSAFSQSSFPSTVYVASKVYSDAACSTLVQTTWTQPLGRCTGGYITTSSSIKVYTDEACSSAGPATLTVGSDACQAVSLGGSVAYYAKVGAAAKTSNAQRNAGMAVGAALLGAALL